MFLNVFDIYKTVINGSQFLKCYNLLTGNKLNNKPIVFN